MDGTENFMTKSKAKNRKRPAAVADAARGSAKIHDYTKRYCGHDYTITDVRKRGMEISMIGWGHGISEGDYMLIEGQSKEPGANPDTRYQVKTIRYLGDPPDMWSMEATFAPRMSKSTAVKNAKAKPRCASATGSAQRGINTPAKSQSKMAGIWSGVSPASCLTNRAKPTTSHTSSKPIGLEKSRTGNRQARVRRSQMAATSRTGRM